MRARWRYAVLLVAVLALAAAKPAPPKVEFPGPGAAVDPEGRYLIEWRAATYATPHELLLTDVRSQTSVLLWEFRRRVGVLWAPGGRHVAVTDFGASDSSDVLVFRLSDLEAPVRMSSVLDASKGSFRGRLVKDGAARFEAIAWQSESALRLRASDGSGSDETLLDYRTGGSLREVGP